MLALRANSTSWRLGTASAAAAAPLRPRSASRTQSVRCASLFGGLFGGDSTKTAEDMGAQGSKAERPGWAPASGDSSERKISRAGFDVTPLTAEQREAEAAKLTAFQRHVTLEQGTERAFTGVTVNGVPHNSKKKGTYVSAIGGLPLFDSSTKFESGTGWPSFYAPIDKEHIVEVVDKSIPWMPRTEVICAKSGAHLGHVFDDAYQTPTGKRYCINAAALKFIEEGEELPHKVDA